MALRGTIAQMLRPLGIVISAPMTLRTRAQGGWSGKSLYITTSGFKVK